MKNMTTIEAGDRLFFKKGMSKFHSETPGKSAPTRPQSNRRNDTWHSCRWPHSSARSILVKALNFGFPHQTIAYESGWIHSPIWQLWSSQTILLIIRFYSAVTALTATDVDLMTASIADLRSKQKTTLRFVLAFSEFSNFKRMFERFLKCCETKINPDESSTLVDSCAMLSQIPCPAHGWPSRPSKVVGIFSLQLWER